MAHRLTLSPRRARVLRWCERKVDADLVAVWGPEDKQTLAALVMDGLVMPTGSRFELTPDGVRALQAPVQETPLLLCREIPPLTESQWDAIMDTPAPDFPPANPEE